MDFAMRFSPFMRVLMALILMGRRHARIHVDDQELQVRMGVGGWGYAARVPRSSIRSVTIRTQKMWGWGWGAHGWNGRWLVNGSMQGLVTLDIDPPARARCLGWPVRLRQLVLSLEEPQRFVEAFDQ